MVELSSDECIDSLLCWSCLLNKESIQGPLGSVDKTIVKEFSKTLSAYSESSAFINYSSGVNSTFNELLFDCCSIQKKVISPGPKNFNGDTLLHPLSHLMLEKELSHAAHRLFNKHGRNSDSPLSLNSSIYPEDSSL